MKISDLRMARLNDGEVRLSAVVGDHVVYFQYKNLSAPLVTLGDPFLLVALVAAMEANEPIEISPEIAISARLLQNLERYQSIFTQWYRHLSRVPVHCTVQTKFDGTGQGTGCFFSGGVDSFYSLSLHRSELSALILCRGLDIPQGEVERWERTAAAVAQVAAEHSLETIFVDTNAKTLYRSRKTDNHGLILGSTALAIGLETLIIPATHAFDDLRPWGSHPLTDPLMSNDVTTVLHDGSTDRVAKIRAILADGLNLESLRVCNRFTDYNCGRCEKCIRTMVPLEILGASATALPELGSPVGTLPLRIEHPNVASMWMDNLRLAKAEGRMDIVREIERALGRYRQKNAVRTMDDEFLGSRLQKLARFLRARRSR